jgi:DNA-binding XRE family transcriptional regulator
MSIKEHTNTPSVDESLAFYVQRMRKSLGLSQKELALKAGVHLQSIGKIERGKTTRLNQKMRSGLAIAFFGSL